ASRARAQVEHLVAAHEQAVQHVCRMHESELAGLRSQAAQRRRERAHRLEQDFEAQRRTLEQSTAHMGFELEQERRDRADAADACAGIRQQVEAMRGTLDEMLRREGQAERDAAQAREEAAAKEAEAAALQGEVAVLLARQRAAGLGAAPPPPGSSLRPGAAAANAAQAAAAAVLAE
ncbi:unnamed protein product, partial [Prorocentrum cordatum]